MSECRALTNFAGNAVATVVARWEIELDRTKFAAAMAGELPEDEAAYEPELQAA